MVPFLIRYVSLRPRYTVFYFLKIINYPIAKDLWVMSHALHKEYFVERERSLRRQFLLIFSKSVSTWGTRNRTPLFLPPPPLFLNIQPMSPNGEVQALRWVKPKTHVIEIYVLVVNVRTEFLEKLLKSKVEIWGELERSSNSQRASRVSLLIENVWLF